MTAVTHFPLECIYFHFVSHNKVSVGISCALGLANRTVVYLVHVFRIPGIQQAAVTAHG